MRKLIALTLTISTAGMVSLASAETTTETNTRTRATRVAPEKPTTGTAYETETTRTYERTDPAATTPPPAWSAYENESDETYSTSAAAERNPQADEMGGDTGEAMAGKQMYVAPKLGVMVPFDLDGYDTAFVWGGEIGFRASKQTTLGVNVSTTSDEIGPIDTTVTPIMLKWARYPQLQNGAWYGLQAGLVNVKTKATLLGVSGSASDREFGAGLAFGYDYKINPMFSTGLEVNHVTVFGDDMFHLLNFLVPLKVHF